VGVTSGAGTVTGNVSLTVDSTTTSKALSSGSATFTSSDNSALASPSAGDHVLSASYAAQGNFAASGPTVGNLHVNQASTTTAITSAATVIYPANGSVTVTVTSAAGAVTGNVSLTVDSTTTSKALSSGSATFTSSENSALTSPGPAVTR